MTLPLVQYSDRWLGPNGVVVYRHAYLSLSINSPPPLGTWNIGWRSGPPASTRSTLLRGPADSLFASTHPAEPAPAMM
ncbi:MAG: hypothetical protein JWQ86_1131 [Mycobacterium sp.]|nr:hypothetical protein [Mycobacterium sp.]